MEQGTFGEHMDDRLQEHGAFDLRVMGGNIIYVDAEGPFNVEAFAHYHKRLEKKVATLSVSKWRHVAVLRGLCAFTPEVMEVLVEHMKWRSSVGCKSDAVAWIDAEGVMITEAQLRRVYDDNGVEYAFFKNIDEAINWTKGLD